MLFESPALLASLSSQKHEDEMGIRVGSAKAEDTVTWGRKRAASTSCFNTESVHSILSNLDSIFNYLPSSPRQNHRSSWNPASFKQFKLSTQPTRPAAIAHPTPLPTSISSSASKTTATTISSLPTELLCLIFESYLAPSACDEDGDTAPDSASNPFGFFSVSSSYVRTPLPLTHVCRSWRNAAISHRKLWSRLAIAVGDEVGTSAQSLEWMKSKGRLVSLFVERAGGMGLSVALSTSPCAVGGDEYDGSLREVVRRLGGASRSWRDLTVQLGRVRDTEIFLEELVTQASLPSPTPAFAELERLQLDLANEDEDDFDSEDNDALLEERLLTASLRIKDIYSLILRRAPALTSLVLDDNFFVWAEGGDYTICPSYQPYDDVAESLPVPWSQLKALAINCNGISSRKVLDVCSRATGLEELTVWRVGRDGGCDIDLWSDTPSLSSSTSVKMENLKRIDVTLLTDPESIFGRMEAPVIESIEVDVQALEAHGYWGEIRSSPQRASLHSILKPIDRILTGENVSVRCRVKASCLELPAGAKLGEWMNGEELPALTRCGGALDVYGRC